MEKAVLVSTVLCALLTFAAGSVCEGIWKIDKVEKCENYEQYPIALEVSKKKVARNTDGFSMEMKLPEDFDSNYGLRLESYEKCDGGYKASDLIAGAACDMLNRYVKENFQDLLGAAGVESRNCPIPKGKFEIKDYVVNYATLPEQGKCGDYKWDIFLIKNGEKQSCVRAFTTFTAKEENYEEEEEDR